MNRRFVQPLPEFYKRRIIFWCDEEREFEDKLDEIVLNDANLVALTGTNYFAVKKLLGVEDITGNYVVYCPFYIKSLKYDKREIYYLVIANEKGEIKGQEEFQIDIALAVDEFDFFG